VHRGGGVSIGLADVPPANGLLVSGTVAIGTVTPGSYYKLNVVNSATYGGGINIIAGTYGLVAESNQTGIYGKGKNEGIYGYSPDGFGVDGYSNNGFGGTFESVTGTALRASTWSGTYAAVFNGSTYSSGSYTGSDKNIKRNIQEVGNAMSIINKLKPKYYEFKDDGNYASLHLPKGKHYGLLAQEVEAVLPDLVKESVHEIRTDKPRTTPNLSADGKSGLPATNREPIESMNIKAVNYTELIPIMIKAMQEQQQENNALKERITKLEAALKTGGNFNLNNPDPMGISLEQNTPNPASATTTFRYSIPKEAKAQILVYNNAGKLIKSIVAPYGGQVQMESSDLPAGNYIYTLVIDGKQAATKHMTITK
jgi:hypothetical protein